jgi:hypothetical protein
VDIEVLSDFVEEVLQKPSVTVIAANPANPSTGLATASPAKPYCSIKVMSEKDQGLPISEAESISPSEVNQLITTDNIANVELQFYSNEITGEFSAQNLAEFFITARGFQRSKDFERANNFSVMNVRPRFNADISLGDLIERREIVEFTVNYVYTITDADVPFFNEAGIRITVEQED